jgi:shikimate kinase
MKLVFLYGPPAVGKYTIGAMLAEKTGYRFVHNHVTVDIAKLVFPHKTDQNRQAISDLKDTLRLDVIRAAALADISLITTLAYTAGQSDEFVKAIIKAVSETGSSLYFVRLTAPRETLYERIANESRAALKKKGDPKVLERKFEQGGLDEPISFVESLELNTAELSPEQSVQRIIDKFAL